MSELLRILIGPHTLVTVCVAGAPLTRDGLAQLQQHLELVAHALADDPVSQHGAGTPLDRRPAPAPYSIRGQALDAGEGEA
jgi:hypothetical protein